MSADSGAVLGAATPAPPTCFVARMCCGGPRDQQLSTEGGREQVIDCTKGKRGRFNPAGESRTDGRREESRIGN